MRVYLRSNASESTEILVKCINEQGRLWESYWFNICAICLLVLAPVSKRLPYETECRRT